MAHTLAAKFLLLIFILGMVSAAAESQTTQTPETSKRPRKVFPAEQPAEDVIRVDTDLVSVDVSAIDAEGRPIRNLRPQDFKVFSDGVEQQLSFFQIEKRQGEPRPLAVVFALDVSGSMTAEEMNR